MVKPSRRRSGIPISWPHHREQTAGLSVQDQISSSLPDIRFSSPQHARVLCFTHCAIDEDALGREVRVDSTRRGMKERQALAYLQDTFLDLRAGRHLGKAG